MRNILIAAVLASVTPAHASVYEMVKPDQCYFWATTVLTPLVEPLVRGVQPVPEPLQVITTHNNIMRKAKEHELGSIENFAYTLQAKAHINVMSVKITGAKDAASKYKPALDAGVNDCLNYLTNRPLNKRGV